MAAHGDSPLSHVVDHSTFELPHWAFPYAKEIDLPSLAGIQLTRFMVTEVISAMLVIVIVMSRHEPRVFRPALIAVA